MPQFVVVASVMMVRSITVEAKTSDELREKLNDRLRLPSGEWDLRDFQIEEGNVQLAELANMAALQQRIVLPA